MNPIKYSLKERQQIAGDWLLPDNLSRKLTVYCEQTCNGEYLRTAIRDGRIGDYLITWLDFPTSCFKAGKVRLSFRRPLNESCPAYVIIRIGEGELS